MKEVIKFSKGMKIMSLLHFLTMSAGWWLSPVARDHPEMGQEWNDKKSFLFLIFPYLGMLEKQCPSSSS